MAMWNVLITMTTIGYGDYYPISHCGRVVAIITAFWGVLDTSLFVLACLNITKFEPSEAKAY
jgi:Ion channel